MKTQRDDRTAFILRLPVDLRERLSAAAEQNFRSVTAECNFRLRNSFEPKRESAAA